MKNIIIFLFTFLLFNNVNSQDWKWKNPLPTGNQLNCVEFIDSSTAYAIGNFGTILKTTDGGLNWDIQESGTNINLFTMSVIDKDTLYVCGENLNVLKSTNGGNSWENIFNESWSNNKNIIFFVNAATGYLAGDGSTLLKTIDYGQTWIDLNVGFEFQNPYSLFFTSIDTGYATTSNSEILKTTDGGLNWLELDLPMSSRLSTITFINDSTGFSAGSLGAILKTTDFGNSWIIQNEFPSGITSSDLLSIDFINDSIGFIVGSRDILKTSNGGNTWQIIAQSEFDLFSVSFTDSLHGIAVGGDWLYEVSGIQKTNNGGLDWIEASSTITTKYLDEVKFINSDTGYAVGGHVSATYSGYILKTTDAGDSWSNLNIGTDTYWLTDIVIPSNDTIYVIAWEGQILKSTDAGSTWSELNSNTRESLYAADFVNSKLGYVVGENGTILKTNDGGNTWINQVSPTDKDLRTIYFKNENEGFSCAYDWNIDSTILITTIDGGENWLKKSIGTVRNPRKIYFVNNDTAFIAGDFGGILRTFDGGSSWESSYHNGNDYFDIYFTNNYTGYVVGEDGEISMTENCGDDWFVLSSGTEKQLRSIYFTDINTGYATGSNGVIVKTTNSGSRLKSLYQPHYSICKGDTILLRPNYFGGAKPLSYHWNNTVTSDTILVSPKIDTIYTITITDLYFDSIKIEIPVNVYTHTAPYIHQSGDTLISDIEYGNQWYRNDTLIDSANSNKLLVELEGDYYSIYVDYPCYSEKSNVIQIRHTSTFQTLKKDIKIYPNPVTSNLTVELSNITAPCYLKIIGINGREYYNSDITENIKEIDLKALPQGLFLVQIISADKVITNKIIKK